jgi:hypothetical protein
MHLPLNPILGPFGGNQLVIALDARHPKFGTPIGQYRRHASLLRSPSLRREEVTDLQRWDYSTTRFDLDQSESFLVCCNTPTKYKEAVLPRYGRHMTCPTTSSFGTLKPCRISRVMLLPVVSLAKFDEEIREALGNNKFPKHIYHSVVCIGALVAHKERDHWAVDALGAPRIKF